MVVTVSKDSLWKGIIEDLFAEFLLYFFPVWAMNEVDFSRDFEFLDKELSELIPESLEAKRYVDKLVKVHIKNGKMQWCLIDAEV